MFLWPCWGLRMKSLFEGTIGNEIVMTGVGWKMPWAELRIRRSEYRVPPEDRAEQETSEKLGALVASRASGTWLKPLRTSGRPDSSKYTSLVDVTRYVRACPELSAAAQNDDDVHETDVNIAPASISCGADQLEPSTVTTATGPLGSSHGRRSLGDDEDALPRAFLSGLGDGVFEVGPDRRHLR